MPQSDEKMSKSDLGVKLPPRLTSGVSHVHEPTIGDGTNSQQSQAILRASNVLQYWRCTRLTAGAPHDGTRFSATQHPSRGLVDTLACEDLLPIAAAEVLLLAVRYLYIIGQGGVRAEESTFGCSSVL